MCVCKFLVDKQQFRQSVDRIKPICQSVRLTVQFHRYTDPRSDIQTPDSCRQRANASLTPHCTCNVKLQREMTSFFCVYNSRKTKLTNTSSNDQKTSDSSPQQGAPPPCVLVEM